MSLASQSPERGRLLLAPGIGLTLDEIAEAAGSPPELFTRAIDAFQTLSMVHIEDGVYVITHWSQRQFQSDSSTARVQKFRSQKPVPLPVIEDAEETLQKRFYETDQNRTEQNRAEQSRRQTRAETAPSGAGESRLSNADRAALEECFIQLTGIASPRMATLGQKKQAGQSWWTPLREIATLVDCDIGEAKRLISETWTRLDGKVTVSCPRSLVKTATAIAAEWRRDNGAGAGPRVEF
jgi:hypothetical protein